MRDDSRLGDLGAVGAHVFGDRVEGTEVPTPVALDRRQMPVDVGALRLGVEIGPLATERLVDQQVTDRHRRRRRSRQYLVAVIRMLEMSSTFVSVVSTATLSKARSSPPTLSRRRRVTDDLEPLEVVDEVDQWLAERLAFARQQQVDDAECVLRSERIHQTGSDLGRARRATIVAGDDLADGETAGTEERDDSDQATDDLALAALAHRVRGHDRRSRRALQRRERRRRKQGLTSGSREAAALVDHPVECPPGGVVRTRFRRRWCPRSCPFAAICYPTVSAGIGST